MTRLRSPLLLLALLAAAWLWHRGAVRAAVAGARSDARADSIAGAVHVRDSLAALRTADSAAAAARHAQLTARLTSIRSRLDVLTDSSSRLAAALDTLLAADTRLADPTRAVVLATVRTLQAQGRTCSLALLTCDSIAAGLRLELAAAYGDVAGERLLRERLSQAFALERRRTAPWGPLRVATTVTSCGLAGYGLGARQTVLALGSGAVCVLAALR